MNKLPSWLVVLGALMSALSLSAAEPALKSGDRVVFLGDSITQAGAGPGGYILRFETLLRQRQPELKVEIVGAGISGNRVPDLEKRLERDVLAKKPTVVVIYIGINDVWHSLMGRGTSVDDFRAGLTRIIESLRGAGSRVVLCTPSVIGEKKPGDNPLDAKLDEYSGISREVAKAAGLSVIDLRTSFQQHLREHNPMNAEKGVLTTDGVHLNEAGNQFVAEQMANGLGVPANARVLRHVVLFKFNAECSEEQVAEVVEAFRRLPSRISEVRDFEWGTDVSPEEISDGFKHCFFLTFATEADRDRYLVHPAHQEFVTLVKPRLEKALVVDYWTNK